MNTKSSFYLSNILPEEMREFMNKCPDGRLFTSLILSLKDKLESIP